MAAGADQYSEGSQAAWEQGSLLSEGIEVSPLQWVHPAAPATKIARGVVTAASRKGEVAGPLQASGPHRQGERMMVITHSCDLAKTPAELPQIEVARVFATDNARVVAEAQDFGSARFYWLARSQAGGALVLDYGQRALLDKGFLEAERPDNSILRDWVQDDRRLFARWLGQRYSRPAISDRDYEEITRPIRDAWAELEAGTAAGFNREYAELRYRREEDDTLTLFILSRDSEPDEATALELIAFLHDALAQTFGDRIQVPTDRRTYHTFTKADELSSEQISMEWASHLDESLSAALPAD